MQKRLYLTPLAIIAFILYFTVFGDRGLLRINHLHRDRDEMQKRLLEVQGENDRLKREIAALQSDRRYLESIARRDFGLVRGNEVIYQFPGKGPAPTPQAAAKPADPKDQKPADPKAEQKKAEKGVAVQPQQSAGKKP
ncbi:FtsB family cell division protein [Geomonas sp.]|uniref:FtsB family cell division protein n=1 Tax=Geomonas sp. TaxID=2651584 RepID=UPI002B49FD24|nr:septum formation initiator family protein [Geomonas sp.]HJV36009.1 septum formation initiator family protein [Geomonas sp.]